MYQEVIAFKRVSLYLLNHFCMQVFLEGLCTLPLRPMYPYLQISKISLKKVNFYYRMYAHYNFCLYEEELTYSEKVQGSSRTCCIRLHFFLFWAVFLRWLMMRFLQKELLLQNNCISFLKKMTYLTLSRKVRSITPWWWDCRWVSSVFC